MNHKLLLFLVVLSVTGCVLEEMRHDDRSDAGRGFSVEQAKEFFENDYVDNYFQQSRSLLKSKKLSLHLHLRNRYFGNGHFATKYRKP